MTVVRDLGEAIDLFMLTTSRPLEGPGRDRELFERLASLGVEAVTLCLDNDEAGRSATARTVEQAARATKCPTLFVVDPRRLGSAKDPDAYVLTRGIAAWGVLLEERECAIGWRAAEHLRDVTEASPQDVRREGLSRVGTWLGKLPPRLTLEQEDAVKAAAERCGYSIDAVQRSFRARSWPEPGRDVSLAQEGESPSGAPGREPIEPGPDL